jgi:hypothetical protein
MAESHVLSALKRRYAQTLDLKARGFGVLDDLDHLAAVILMFDPQADLGAIKPIRRSHGRGGKWQRLAIRIMRQRGVAMSASELADAIISEGGLEPNRRQRDSMISSLHASLGSGMRGIVCLPGTPKRWAVEAF